jgi:hypothetical protein
MSLNSVSDFRYTSFPFMLQFDLQFYRYDDDMYSESDSQEPMVAVDFVSSLSNTIQIR